MSRTLTLIGVSFLILAFGFLSGMEYDAERQAECERRGKAYDRKADVCAYREEVSRGQ